MNSKRQTIWLVSMLSLMVVLSAYYLFTDSPGQMKTASGGAQTENSDLLNAQKADQSQGITAKEVTDQNAADQNQMTADNTDAKDNTAAADSQTDKALTDAQDGQATAQANQGDSASAADAAGKTDAQVLEDMKTQASSGTDYFIALQLKRNEDMQKRSDDLMKIISDSSLDSDSIGKAYDEMNKLEEVQAKISNLEGELLQDYPNAVVTQEANDNWQVVVQSDKLEKSQAVSILDQVTKELDVQPGQVVIKYMK